MFAAKEAKPSEIMAAIAAQTAILWKDK